VECFDYIYDNGRYLITFGEACTLMIAAVCPSVRGRMLFEIGKRPPETRSYNPTLS